MVNKTRKLVIDNKAKKQLQEAYNYIKKDSPKNASKVKHNILVSIRNLIDNPEIHALDRLKINNNNSYRSYELLLCLTNLLF